MSSTDRICPGPCNARWRKAEALRRDALRIYNEAHAAWEQHQEGPEPAAPEPHGVVPWSGDPVWCGRDAAIIHKELAEFDDLICLIEREPDMRGQADTRTGKVSGSREQPSPSPAADLVDELASWMRWWEAEITGGAPAAPRGFLAKETTILTGILVTAFRRIITAPVYALEFGTDVRAWHRRLVSRAKAGLGVHHMKRPCPRCSLYTLWWEEGDDYVRCRNDECPRIISRNEYDEVTAESVLIMRGGRKHAVTLPGRHGGDV